LDFDRCMLFETEMSKVFRFFESDLFSFFQDGLVKDSKTDKTLESVLDWFEKVSYRFSTRIDVLEVLWETDVDDENDLEKSFTKEFKRIGDLINKKDE
jgi:hypothetical protein